MESITFSVHIVWSSVWVLIILVRMIGKVLIKPVDIAIWPAEFTIDLHKPSIFFLSISAMSVVTSTLVRYAFVRVLTDAVDLVSGF